MCKLFIKDQQPVKVPEDFKYSLRCAINTIFFLSPMVEREGAGGGGQTKGQRNTDRRTDGRTNNQTDIHRYASGAEVQQCLSSFLATTKINLIKGNSPTEEFLIYIFEIKHGVLTESYNKAT